MENSVEELQQEKILCSKTELTEPSSKKRKKNIPNHDSIEPRKNKIRNNSQPRCEIIEKPQPIVLQEPSCSKSIPIEICKTKDKKISLKSDLIEKKQQIQILLTEKTPEVNVFVNTQIFQKKKICF